MKTKWLVTIMIMVAFFSVSKPVFAVSNNASPMACFGQGRASYALYGDYSVGYWASQRKGDNSWMNAVYREACQPPKPTPTPTPEPTPVLVDTVIVDPTSYEPTYSHISLANGQEYLFEVSGTFTNTGLTHIDNLKR